MATKLAPDERLVEPTQSVGGHRTKKATVTEALKAYSQCRKQAKILALFGTVEFDARYDYKKQRRKS